jgi:hypothetical protein
MDFLRMEGEAAFLKFFPNEYAREQLEFWYRGEESQVETYLAELNKRDFETSAITYKTTNPKKEFFEKYRAMLGSHVTAIDVINTKPKIVAKADYQRSLQKLSDIKGLTLEHIPEQSLMRLSLDNGEYRLISLIRNRSHTNVSHLFGEQNRFVPEEQTLSVIDGVVGTYPNIFFDVKEADLNEFVDLLSMVKSEQDYASVLKLFGVRRTNKDFWRFSDSIHQIYMQASPIEAGLLDFNRLENR